MTSSGLNGGTLIGPPGALGGGLAVAGREGGASWRPSNRGRGPARKIEMIKYLHRTIRHRTIAYVVAPTPPLGRALLAHVQSIGGLWRSQRVSEVHGSPCLLIAISIKRTTVNRLESIHEMGKDIPSLGYREAVSSSRRKELRFRR